MGLRALRERLHDPSLQQSFEGLFPRDSAKNTCLSPIEPAPHEPTGALTPNRVAPAADSPSIFGPLSGWVASRTCSEST